MARLRYLTRRTVDGLRQSIAERLDWYYEPNGRSCLEGFPTDAWRPSKISVQPLAPLLAEPGSSPSASDATNAIIVYQNMRELTPQQAADERVWVHLSHSDCMDYVAKRWLHSQPRDTEDAIQKVANHHFAPGSRALIRDHGVSRLWWLGSIAHDVHPHDPRLFLDIVLHRQDVRSALIERPSVSMNRRVLRGIFAVMRDYWEDGRELFKREVFRTWMVNLNRRGGVVLLDALPEDQLLRLLREEAEQALETEG